MIPIPAYGTKTTKEATEEYNSAILNYATPRVQIICHKSGGVAKYFDENDISNDGGITISTVLNPDSDLTIKNIVWTECVIHFIKSAKTDEIDWTKEITLSFGIEINGSIKYSYAFNFSGDEPQRQKSNGQNIIIFTGYSTINGLGEIADDFVATLTFPLTVRQISDALETYLGKQINITAQTKGYSSNINKTINDNPFPVGCTYQEIILWLAEILGCYVTRRLGTANIISLLFYGYPDVGGGNMDYTLTKNHYFELQKSEYEVPTVPAVGFIDTTDSTNNEYYPSTYSGVPYKIIDNPLFNHMSSADKTSSLQVLRENRLSYGDDELRPIYIPMQVTAIGNWLVEAGDIINIEDEDGTILPMRIFARTLTWHGGLCEDVYECTGSVTRMETSEYEQTQYKINKSVRAITKPLLAQKYDVVSGVGITGSGVSLTSDKQTTCGNWIFDAFGARAKGTNQSGTKGFQIFAGSGIYPAGETPPDLSTEADEFAGMTAQYGNGLNDSELQLLVSDEATSNYMAGLSMWYHKNVNVRRAYLAPKASKNMDSFDLGTSTYPFTNIFANSYQGDGVKNNLTTSSAGYVLDARQGKALEDGKLDKVSRSTISSNNGTAAITIANNAAHMIVIAGNNNGNKGIIIAISNASGSVTYVNVNTMSGITVTTATNKITLKNTTSNNCYAYDFVLTSMY